MWQYIVVTIILAICLFVTGRVIYRGFAGKSKGKSCGSCSCSSSKPKPTPAKPGQ